MLFAAVVNHNHEDNQENMTLSVTLLLYGHTINKK